MLDLSADGYSARILILLVIVRNDPFREPTGLVLACFFWGCALLSATADFSEQPFYLIAGKCR